MQAAKTPDSRLLAVFKLRLPPDDTLASRPILYVYVPTATHRSAQRHNSSWAGLTACCVCLMRLCAWPCYKSCCAGRASSLNPYRALHLIAEMQRPECGSCVCKLGHGSVTGRAQCS